MMMIKLIQQQQQRRMRNRRDEKLYLLLSEAMECLEHIFTEGCIGVNLQKKASNNGPCKNFSTCRSLQLLLHHFATCKIRASGGCPHCKRMHQLLRLHSFLCYQPGPCKIPLCGYVIILSSCSFFGYVFHYQCFSTP